MTILDAALAVIREWDSNELKSKSDAGVLAMANLRSAISKGSNEQLGGIHVLAVGDKSPE